MNWSARDAEGADIGDGWGRNAGRRHRDQPRQPVGGAQALGDAIVPRHDVEDEAALREAHDVEPRHSARQIERDIACGVTTIGERCADFTKRSKCLGSERCDGNAVHIRRSLAKFEKKSLPSGRIRASRDPAHRPATGLRLTPGLLAAPAIRGRRIADVMAAAWRAASGCDNRRHRR